MPENAQPVIVVAGSDENIPPWLRASISRLEAHYRVVTLAQRAAYVTRLADAVAALIVVDGDRDGWPFWVTTPKSSPATRRIPVMCITDDPATRQQALSAGADLALSPEDWLDDLVRLVGAFARVVDPAVARQLACDCEAPLPELAQQGIEKFNAGQYYAQHDLFEALWVETEGPVRDLYRAILQVGVAYYQIIRGNHRGARKMLLRSLQWLAILPDECQGVDVRALRQDSARVRAALEALPEAHIDQFDTALLQPVKMTAR